MASVGFIGVGVMGREMVLNLLKGGHRVRLFDARPEAAESLRSHGAEVAVSVADAVSDAEVAITMLPDTPQVEEVLFGENGAAQGIDAGKIVVDMSSISPLATKSFAHKLHALGADYLDAPVSGGEIGAKSASLTIMVGGTETAFAKMRPIFEAMGKNITLVGGNGDGQTAKVANQIIVALTIEAVAEGLLFASKAGADPIKVRQALMGGLASSRILELHGERMIKRTFMPGFRIHLHEKDLDLALTAAKALHLALPNTALCQQLFQSCAANGAADADHSGVVMALERMANHQVAPDPSV